MRVWSSCKVPFELRNSLAEMLGLTREQVVVVPCNIGGDFGGKNSIGPEPIAYWLAQRTGRPVKIVNSDGTLHNVHAVPKENTEFNFGQPLKGMESTQTFTKAEIMVPFRCDVHGWMAAYGGIVPHPFFAVTRNDGTFEIKGLPAGTYTIETWHERFGLQTQTVTVDGTAAGTADFNYKAS